MQNFRQEPMVLGFSMQRMVLDERPVVTESEPVSMSRETTFEKDLHVVQRPRCLGRHLHPLVPTSGC
jgi:hypothetical protein